MKNLKSGTCAKLFYKKYTPLCGKMKVIASENVKELMLAIGELNDNVNQYFFFHLLILLKYYRVP